MTGLQRHNRAFDELDKSVCSPEQTAQLCRSSGKDRLSLRSYFPWLPFSIYAVVQICSAGMGTHCSVE